MPIQENLITDLANKFIAAEDQREPLDPITSVYPNLTVDDAYRVQMALVRFKAKRGDKVIGKKVGASNETIQRMLGLDEPLFGHLFAGYQISNGATISLSQFIQPRIECEIAFLLKKDLIGPGITTAKALEATEAVMASFEINDPRTRDWKLGKCELAADNTIAARFVLSDRRVSAEGLDLSQIGVVFKKNGEKIAESTGAAVLGDPAKAVAWLANKLAEYNFRLEAREIVLPGSLTPVHPISAGDRFEAIFDQLGSVSVGFV